MFKFFKKNKLETTFLQPPIILEAYTEVRTYEEIMRQVIAENNGKIKSYMALKKLKK